MIRILRLLLITIVVVCVTEALGVAPAGAAPTPSGPAPAGPATLLEQPKQQARCLIPRRIAARCAPRQAAPALTRLLTTFSQIPNRVLLQGDAATRRWLRANGAARPGTDPRLVDTGDAGFRLSFARIGDAPARPDVQRVDALRCIGAIGTVVGGLLIPAIKILKIKKLMDQIGGVWETVQLLIGGSTRIERIEAVATALGVLVAELVGITAIRDFCFT